jgi:hypothetical protein
METSIGINSSAVTKLVFFHEPKSLNFPEE